MSVVTKKNYPRWMILFLLLLAIVVSSSSASSSPSFLSPQRHAASVISSLKQQEKFAASLKQSNVDFNKNKKNIVRGGSSETAGPSTMRTVTSAATLFLLDWICKQVFRIRDIKFPPMLGGCILLFTVMILGQSLLPGNIGDAIYQNLLPGTQFWGKWLAVFFVPGLAMLPMAPSMGSQFEVVKLISLVILGFLFTLSTVGFSVLTVRSLAGTTFDSIAITPTASSDGVVKKPYSDETFAFWYKMMFGWGIVSILTTRFATNFPYKSTLQAIFHFSASLSAYIWGARLPKSFTKVVHPLATCTVLTWLTIYLTSIAVGSNFMEVLKMYKVGSLHWKTTGAGDYLLSLLGPAVVSFAVSMYSRKQLLMDNFFIVAMAICISSLGGLFGTAGIVRLIQLGGKDGKLVRLSVLPRNVTTALAIAIATILGGNVSIASSVVVMTGIIAATFGRTILDKMGIKDAVSRGLAIGCAGQGLGASSIIPEPDAFPFAAMGMILTAVLGTTLVSIPPVKQLLIDIVSSASSATTETTTTAT